MSEWKKDVNPTSLSFARVPPPTPGCSLPPAKSPSERTPPTHTLIPPGRPAGWPQTLSCLCLIRGGCRQAEGSTFHLNTIWKAAHQVAQLGLTRGRGAAQPGATRDRPPRPDLEPLRNLQGWLDIMTTLCVLMKHWLSPVSSVSCSAANGESTLC